MTWLFFSFQPRLETTAGMAGSFDSWDSWGGEDHRQNEATNGLINFYEAWDQAEHEEHEEPEDAPSQQPSSAASGNTSASTVSARKRETAAPWRSRPCSQAMSQKNRKELPCKSNQPAPRHKGKVRPRRGRPGEVLPRRLLRFHAWMQVRFLFRVCGCSAERAHLSGCAYHPPPRPPSPSRPQGSQVLPGARFRGRRTILSDLERSRAPVRPKPLRAPTLEKLRPRAKLARACL